MGIVIIDPVLLVFHTAGCNIDLASDNWFDSLRAACLIKGYCTVHNAVIGHGQRIHFKLFGPFYQIRDTAGTVQQTVFGMNM